MPEYRVVEVQSNVDRLNERAVHRLFRKMIERLVDQGETIMREVAPKDRGELAAHVGHHGPDDAGDLIWADIGVPPILSARTRAYASFFERDPADYPLFVAQGTGLEGENKTMVVSPTGGTMRFDGADGVVFTKATRGQEPNPFVRDTFEALRHGALPVDARIFAAQVQHLYLPGSDL
jgi:hypothetical protein